MSGLFTNDSERRDFIRDAILQAADGVEEIYVASAFFTNADVVEELAREAKVIRIVVRLQFPTDPDALAAVLKLGSVQVRYFSHPSFHPKLYLFGDRMALVGSANLTRAALFSNQEIVVTIDPVDPRFGALQQLFNEYWDFARVLTPEAVDQYRRIHSKHARLGREIEQLNREIEEAIGGHAFPNINRGAVKERHDNIYLESYRRTYQETTGAFGLLRAAYTTLGVRKIPAETYPLRLEIDLLINHVRDEYALGDRWQTAPVGWNEERKDHFLSIARAWHARPWKAFEVEVIEKLYPRLRAAFASREHLLATDDDTLFAALSGVHSFRERLRFHEGGLPGLRRFFFEHNESLRIRTSLAHLIFGTGEVITRMAELIFDRRYKLRGFGQANVQELVGWSNREELPSINGRTTKILRYFGFNVRQLSSE
jgi:HKD family nuclease